ncbi:hypothetical protein [Reinekea sp. G2M2-21]|uniref:hypothetical protein n=1 Tax=Reinekea sp. G2M2-21 TaxID=2788942 RepID=UPI0018A93A85|nr:hypothetical protein [Reinekea sp. G2M2-21]
MRVLKQETVRIVLGGKKTVAQKNREKRLESLKKAKARRGKQEISQVLSDTVKKAKKEICNGLPSGTKVTGTVEINTGGSSHSYSFEDNC